MTHTDLQPATLVLASSSLRRQQLLQGLGLEFRIIVSGVTEEVPGELQPQTLVEVLAKRKAEHVRAKLIEEQAEQSVVLAADTVVVLDGVVLGKPVDKADAVRTLEALQGKEHTVYTGVCVTGTASSKNLVRHSATRVRMRPLSTDRIVRYVETGEPMDKAGSYGIQGLGSTLIESIDGDYFTVVGLPLALTTDMLEEFGISIW